MAKVFESAPFPTVAVINSTQFQVPNSSERRSIQGRRPVASQNDFWRTVRLCILLGAILSLTACRNATQAMASSRPAVVIGGVTLGRDVAVLHDDGTIGAREAYMPSPEETKLGPEVLVKGLPRIATLSFGYVNCAMAQDGVWWNWTSAKAEQRKFAPPGSDVAKISSYVIDRMNTFGLSSDGSLVAWGSSVGGTDTDLNRASGGYLLSMMPMGSVKPPSPIVQIAPAHDLYLRHADGSIEVPGLEHPRIRGLENLKVRDIAVHKEYSDKDTGVLIDSQGDVWSWGVPTKPEESSIDSEQPRSSGYQVPLHKISAIKNAVSVAAGSGTGIALDSAGTVWEWGELTFQKLDRATAAQRFAARRIEAGINVVRIAMPDGRVMALRKDGTVWMWGFGMAPQKAFDHVRLP